MVVLQLANEPAAFISEWRKGKYWRPVNNLSIVMFNGLEFSIFLKDGLPYFRSPKGFRGRVARQSSAKARTAVRIRSKPLKKGK
jgi:hypothetical protein